MPTSMAPTSRAIPGNLSNYKNLLEESPDHAIGKSRGGLTTKTHSLVDGKQRPLVMILGPGQAGDTPNVRESPGRTEGQEPHTGTTRRRPERAMADNAYSSKATGNTSGAAASNA